jgi:hypothetical protein
VKVLAAFFIQAKPVHYPLTFYGSDEEGYTDCPTPQRGKLNPQVDVEHFCDRWLLSMGDFYKALGDLKNKGVVVAIANQLNLQIQAD